MTAWVRTDCPDCGGLYLPIGDVSAWMVLPAVECSYSFACLHCRRLVERPCSAGTLDELARCGASLTTLVAPAGIGFGEGDDTGVVERGPARCAAAGVPLDESDATEFRRLLADDDAFADALRGLGAG